MEVFTVELDLKLGMADAGVWILWHWVRRWKIVIRESLVGRNQVDRLCDRWL